MLGVFKSECRNCTEFPEDKYEELKDKFVRGSIEFLKDNPGQQMIGSFHPITEGDWSEGTYLIEYTYEFMNLCLGDNVNKVDEFIKNNNVDLNIKDSLGRSIVHMLAYSNNVTLLEYFLSKKISVSVTMQDGRSAFHIASIYGYYLRYLLDTVIS